MPDSLGLDTFTAIAACVPIVVLTGVDDDAAALEAVRRGAQDYLVKGSLDGKMLARVVRYAIERHRMQETLRNLSVIDDLTGLYNRRGFLTLAEQHLKLAQRAQRSLMLLFADLDGLKTINDTFGHQQGDAVLLRTARVLKESFRSSDIIARIGRDEFAILAIEVPTDIVLVLSARLQNHLANDNAKARQPYSLSLSVGVDWFSLQQPVSTVEELIAKADASLYEQKSHKRKSP